MARWTMASAGTASGGVSGGTTTPPDDAEPTDEPSPRREAGSSSATDSNGGALTERPAFGLALGGAFTGGVRLTGRNNGGATPVGKALATTAAACNLCCRSSTARSSGTGASTGGARGETTAGALTTNGLRGHAFDVSPSAVCSSDGTGDGFGGGPLAAPGVTDLNGARSLACDPATAGPQRGATFTRGADCARPREDGGGGLSTDDAADGPTGGGLADGGGTRPLRTRASNVT